MPEITTTRQCRESYQGGKKSCASYLPLPYRGTQQAICVQSPDWTCIFSSIHIFAGEPGVLRVAVTWNPLEVVEMSYEYGGRERSMVTYFSETNSSSDAYFAC